MSEHTDRHPVEYVQRVGQLGDAIVDILGDHERRDHPDGERCPIEAINVLAYLAFRVGLVATPEAHALLERRMLDFKAKHAEHNVYGGTT